MSEEEKKLIELVESVKCRRDIPRAILKAFPQITKKPVVFNVNDFQDYPKDEKYLIGKVWVFQSPRERQLWIDSHFVEVVNE